MTFFFFFPHLAHHQRTSVRSHRESDKFLLNMLQKKVCISEVLHDERKRRLGILSSNVFENLGCGRTS